MGCFSSPKLPGPSQQERTLASIAQEQYQYYRSKVVPLQNAEIARAKDVSSPGQRLRDSERGANAAREAFLPLEGVSPNAKSSVIELEAAKASATAGGEAAGKLTNTQRGLNRRSNILSLGRGLSTAGSGVMRRSASFGAGVEATNATSNNIMANAQMQLAGQIGGTALTLGADKWGWFDKNRGQPAQNYSPGQLALAQRMFG